MEKYPGRNVSSKNPLGLYKKVWLRNECQSFLVAQIPSNSYTMRNISLNLYNYQLKTLKMTYKECSDMAKDYYKMEEANDNDLMDTQIVSDTNENISESEVSELEEEDFFVEDREVSDIESESNEDSDEDGNCEGDIEVKAYLACNDIENLVGKEEELPDNIRKSRYYRRQKKKLFSETVESLPVSQVLSQLSQVPGAVSRI